MKLSSETYWNQVGKKLNSISKVLLDMSVPIAIEACINKACSFINVKLQEMYKNTIRSSLIILVLNIAGMLIVCINPFREDISKYIAAILFITSIVYTVVRVIQYLRKYGRVTFDVSKSILKNKSISKGIEKYIYIQFPIIAFTYLGINITSIYFPVLRYIPSLNMTIKTIISVFWKRIVIFIICITTYSICVYWILKPILLKNLTGLLWYDICFYPIYHIISLF